MVIIDCHKDNTVTYSKVRYQIFLLLYRSLTLTTMKPYFWLLTLCLSGLVAAQSHVLDAASLPSKILKSERNYAVYLPDGYEQSSRSYPVLYLLHGYTDNQTGWGINHEYRVRDGGHTWTYWRTALPTLLEFITESFHQK
jgi:S-formylglutathione hydrolase FrmB